MKKLTSAIGCCILVLMLSGCGIELGHYRYPCQNPDNWNAKDCIPPICEAKGVCTKDIIKVEDTKNA
jgi:hypothetical protein